MIRSLTALVASLGLAAHAVAGPYPSYHDPAARVVPSQITSWGTSIVSYAPTAGVGAAFSNAGLALGPSDGQTVSLGDLSSAQLAANASVGAITIQLAARAYDGPGADLAIFENAFAFPLDFGNPAPNDPYVYGELGYVEVSSDGVHFARFPSVSLNVEPDSNGTLDRNELNTPFGRNFAGLDTTNIHNLAGGQLPGIGTPFDLAELASHPLVVGGLVDLSGIEFIRLVDIPGNGAFVDAQGRPIVDTWLTTGSGGLDLDAVGAIYSVPEPTALALLIAGLTAGAVARRR